MCKLHSFGPQDPKTQGACLARLWPEYTRTDGRTGGQTAALDDVTDGRGSWKIKQIFYTSDLNGDLIDCFLSLFHPKISHKWFSWLISAQRSGSVQRMEPAAAGLWGALSLFSPFLFLLLSAVVESQPDCFAATAARLHLKESFLFI